jgi:hypothetical protein
MPFFLRGVFQISVGFSLFAIVHSVLVLVGAAAGDTAVGQLTFNFAVAAMFAPLAYGIYSRSRRVPLLLPWLFFVQYGLLWGYMYALTGESHWEIWSGVAVSTLWAIAIALYVRRPKVVEYFAASAP